MPKVTVAMPIYNDAAHLREAIQSILRQTFTDFSLLVVDDGSTDDSVDIVQAFDDSRIRLVRHEENMGRPHARNTAFDKADSEYFAWMDGDDISLPQRLERQVAFMDAHAGLVACSGQLRFFHQRQGTTKAPLTPAATRAYSVFSSPVCNAVAMMRLQEIRKLGIRHDASLHRTEDFGFWVDLVLGKKAQVCSMRDVLYLYRYTPRPTNDHYHAQVVRDHIFPCLGFVPDDAHVSLHTDLACASAGRVLERHGLEPALNWLETVWQATVDFNPEERHQLAILLRNHAERLMAAGSVKDGWHIWKQSCIGKVWPALLIKTRIQLRKWKNALKGN